MFLFSIVQQVQAQSIPTGSINAGSGSIGGISNMETALTWAFNFFQYLGWAGVLLGIAFVLFALIYKLFNVDNEEAMKNVQGYITKAVLIVIAGLLLISVSFVINFVATLFGVTLTKTQVDSGLAPGSAPIQP